MFKYWLASFVFASLLAVNTQAAGSIDTDLAKAKSSCEAYDNGRFDAADSIQRIDLTGNRSPDDAIVDESKFLCSIARSLCCGSAGCQLHAVIGDQSWTFSWTFQADSWRMIDCNGRPILLVMRDGGWCGGAGAQVCYEAAAWSNGQMLTVMPQVKPAKWRDGPIGPSRAWAWL